MSSSKSPRVLRTLFHTALSKSINKSIAPFSLHSTSHLRLTSRQISTSHILKAPPAPSPTPFLLPKRQIFGFGSKNGEKPTIRPPSYRSQSTPQGSNGESVAQAINPSHRANVAESSPAPATIDLFINHSATKDLSLHQLSQQYKRFWITLSKLAIILTTGAVTVPLILCFSYAFRLRSYYNKVMQSPEIFTKFLTQHGLYQRYPNLNDLETSRTALIYNQQDLEAAALQEFIIYHKLATTVVPAAIEKCEGMKNQIEACPRFLDRFYDTPDLFDLINGIKNNLQSQTTKFVESVTYGLFLQYISSPTPEQRPFLLNQLLNYCLTPQSIVLSTAGHLASSIFQIKLAMNNLDSTSLMVNSLLDPIWCEQFALHFQLPSTNQGFYLSHLQQQRQAIDPATDHQNFDHIHSQMKISLRDLIGIYTYFTFAFNNLASGSLQNSTNRSDAVFKPFHEMQHGEAESLQSKIPSLNLLSFNPLFDSKPQQQPFQAFQTTPLTKTEMVKFFETLRRPQPLPAVLSNPDLIPLFYPPNNNDIESKQARAKLLPHLDDLDQDGDDERRQVIDFTLMPMLCLEGRIERFKYLDIRHYPTTNQYIPHSKPLCVTLPAPFWTYSTPFSMPSLSSRQFYKKAAKMNRSDPVTMQSTKDVQERLLKQYTQNYQLYQMDTIAAQQLREITAQRELQEELVKEEKEKSMAHLNAEQYRIKKMLNDEQLKEYEKNTTLSRPNAVEAPLNVQTKW